MILDTFQLIVFLFKYVNVQVSVAGKDKCAVGNVHEIF